MLHQRQDRNLDIDTALRCANRNPVLRYRTLGKANEITLTVARLRGASAWSRHRDLSGLHEPIGEAIGLTLDRGIEHLDRVRIVLVREHGAFRVQHEAGRLHLLADGRRGDPMQRLGVARARPCGSGVVDDDVGPTGLQPLVDG